MRALNRGRPQVAVRSTAQIALLPIADVAHIVHGPIACAGSSYQADILIAGGCNMYTELKARIPFLDINQEREFGYEGYRGMIE